MHSWSVSSVRQFHQCSLAWFFKRTGVREEFKPVALAEGAAMHECLAHHLRGMKDGKTPSEEESIEILEGAMLGQELEGEVAYGEKKGRDDIRPCLGNGARVSRRASKETLTYRTG